MAADTGNDNPGPVGLPEDGGPSESQPVIHIGTQSGEKMTEPHSADGLDARTIAVWRESWRAMMRTYLPGIDSALSMIFDTVELVTRAAPLRVLDLGGGPGTVTDQVLNRWPQTSVTLVDLDPALLALARAALPHTATVLDADLDAPEWTTRVKAPTDVVLAVMTLHYFPPQRLQALYREIRTLLRPGGMLFVVDHMPDPGLPRLSDSFHNEPPRSTGPHPTWTTWWQTLDEHPAMTPLLRRRAERFARPSAEFTPPAAWHRETAQAAGYSEAGVVWRRGTHAAIVAIA